MYAHVVIVYIHNIMHFYFYTHALYKLTVASGHSIVVIWMVTIIYIMRIYFVRL